MKISIIIPARMSSSRLPEKPLADILGQSLIMRVYRQALRSKLAHETIIATDHPLIFDHVTQHGGRVMLTSKDHLSGTDRIAEVAARLDTDIIINLQGDEPLINPEQIDELIQAMISREIVIGTQCVRIKNHTELFDYSVVKIVRDYCDKVLFFSRQAIPACRDLPYRNWFEKATYFKHVGIYGFRKDILLKITKLPQSEYEKSESLEQLRWMQNGFPIYGFETEYNSIGVDTAEDLEKVREIVLREMMH